RPASERRRRLARRCDRRRRIRTAGDDDRLGLAGRAAADLQRGRPRRLALQPPRCDLERLARRGDDESRQVPTGLPGRRARAQRDGRRPQPPHQPHGPGRALMDRVTNSMASRSVLADIEIVYAQLTATQNELSSGKQLTKPSDNPYGTSRALAYRADLAANKQYQSNASEMGAWLSTTDTALSSINSDLGRVRDLILQGANGTLSPTELASISTELGQLADSIKSDANTQYAGSY